MLGQLFPVAHELGVSRGQVAAALSKGLSERTVAGILRELGRCRPRSRQAVWSRSVKQKVEKQRNKLGILGSGVSRRPSGAQQQDPRDQLFQLARELGVNRGQVAAALSEGLSERTVVGILRALRNCGPRSSQAEWTRNVKQTIQEQRTWRSERSSKGWLDAYELARQLKFDRVIVDRARSLRVPPELVCSHLTKLKARGSSPAIGIEWQEILRTQRLNERKSARVEQEAKWRKEHEDWQRLMARRRASFAMSERPEPLGLSLVPATPSSADQLHWEVLPPGWWKTSLRTHVPRGTPREWPLWTNRIAFLEDLNPRAWYAGSHLGHRLYYVADYGNLAIADCPDFGNALYYTSSGDWRAIFRQTKREAILAGARRLVHRGDWQSRVRSLMKAQLSA
jgi:hypothetical protein